MSELGSVEGGLTSAIGLGIGLIGASKAGQTPPLRNMGQELGAIPYNQQLQQAQKYVQQQFGNDSQYSNLNLGAYPAYVQAQLRGQQAEAGSAIQWDSAFNAQQRTANQQQDLANLQDLNKYGAGYVGAYAGASPGFAAVENQLGQLSNTTPLLANMNAQAMGAGYSPLTANLMGTAQSQLALGAGLSPEQALQADQTAQAAWSARGLDNSNPAVSSEVLARDQYGQQLLAQREAAAGSASAAGLADLSNARQFGLGVQSANQALQGQNQQFTLNAANITSAPLNNMLANPAPSQWNAVLGAYGLAPSTTTPSQVMSQSPSIFQGVQALAPLYNYAEDLNNTNFNAQAAALINQANAYTSLGGGLISAGGQMASGGGGGGGGGMSSMAGMI